MPNTSTARKHGGGSWNTAAGGGGDQSDGGSAQKAQQRSKMARVSDDADRKVLLKILLKRKRGDTKDHPLNQWFMNFSEADELLKLSATHQQVQAHIAKLKRQLSMIEGLPQHAKAQAPCQ